jgi:hypothetical protein
MNGTPLNGRNSITVSIRGILLGTPGHPRTTLVLDALRLAITGDTVLGGAILTSLLIMYGDLLYLLVRIKYKLFFIYRMGHKYYVLKEFIKCQE